MTPERRAQLARGLRKNQLLPELIDERREELRETWEGTEPAEAETRETVYQELRTLNELRDFIYARLDEYSGDGSE